MPRSTPPSKRLAWLLSVPAAGLITWLLYTVQRVIAHTEHTRYVRPYGIVFVLPIALLTLLGGRGPGGLTLLLSAFSLLYVLFAPHFSWQVTHPRDWSELGLLLIVGSVVIYGLEAARRVGPLMSEAAQVRGQLADTQARLAAFHQEVLLAVTNGRLLLCGPEYLARLTTGEPALTLALSETEDVSRLRSALKTLVAARDLTRVRVDDLLTSVTEAAANAVKHGQAGEAQAWAEPDAVIVLISDRGRGIRPSDLARATLQAGFSTQSTLGMGFTLMLEMADLLALHTSEAGTQVLLRVGATPLPSPEDRLLAHYGPTTYGEATAR